MLISEGRQTAPTSGTLLAEIVVTEDSTLYPQIYISSAVIGSIRVQHRNSANDAVVEEFYIDMLAHTQTIVPFTVILTANERVRLVTDTAFLGSVQAGFLS